MDMEMDKHYGCRNADKKFSPASAFRHQHSGIGIPASAFQHRHSSIGIPTSASAFRHHGHSGTASHGLVR
jgi:hypothetical protein